MHTLKSRLFAAAAIWCAAHDDAPLSRLGKRVAGDANFFDRIRPVEPLACNVATVEKFARFFIDPANWPSGATGDEPGAEHQRGRPRGLEAMVPVSPVPEEVLQFCHAVGVTSTTRAMSPGKAGSITPPAECAA